MKNVQKTDAVLLQMIDLLRYGGANDWANLLEELRCEMYAEPSDAASKILSLFGGMGSLNDVVLYKNGIPLVAENDELFKLSALLFESCRSP